MIVWAIANQKGGVGKTTSTITLAGLLAEDNHRVLIVDFDPHASLSYYFDIEAEDIGVSVYDLFQQTLNKEQIMQIVCPTRYENINILPAVMVLATLDRRLGNQQGMGLVLKKALQNITDEYDFVLIDCSPVLGVLMVNALAACQHLIIPVQTDFLALKGLDRMMKTLEIMKGQPSSSFPYTIVPTMYDKRTNSSRLTYDKLIQTYHNTVWSDVIPIDAQLRNASVVQKTPSEYNAKSRAVIAYKKLLADLFNTVKKVNKERF